MADVSGERAQLLVIGAIALAILLIAVALALNTAVVGELHAGHTDRTTHHERAALGYEAGVERGIAGLIVRVNDDPGDWETVDTDLATDIDVWAEAAGTGHAREGVTTGVTLQDLAYDTRIVQDERREYTDHAGNENWTLAEDVSDVQGYEITLDGDELPHVAQCANQDDCFQLVVADEDDNQWALEAYVDGGNDITVRTTEDKERCETEEFDLTLDVTTGTIEGHECTFTPFTEDDGLSAPYTISYVHGQNANGTYELTVGDHPLEGAAEEDERFAAGDGSPRIEPQIRSAQVTVRYRTSGIEYQTETTIQPEGQADG